MNKFEQCIYISRIGTKYTAWLAAERTCAFLNKTYLPTCK
jgi:hypothetical protein